VQKYFKILVLLFVGCNLYAQQAQSLFIQFPETKDGDLVKKNTSYNTYFSDTTLLSSELNKVILQCNELSFMQAAYSSYNIIGDTMYAKLILGNSFKWVNLRKGNVPSEILGGAGFRVGNFEKKTINPLVFARKVERILEYLENNGYPFSTIQLDSIEVDSIGISAALNLQINQLFTFDTIDILGDANVKKWFLYKYLVIKPNESYNEALVSQINARISQLPYLKTSQPSAIYFYGNKAMPILYLTNRKASSIDGVVGFAPNTNTNSSNRLLITGEANLKLQNIAGSGKSFEMKYRSFLGNSQDLNINFLFPYIFRTNLALNYELALLKQDTSFLDVRNEFGIQYRFVGTDYFKIFYSIQNTSLITIDTNQIKLTKTLPSVTDLTNNTYGIGFKITRLDYFLNPRKGFVVDLNGGVGVKKIIKNPSIGAIQFTDAKGLQYSVYDSLQLEYIQYRMQGMAECFIPFFSRATVRLQANGGHIVAQSLFTNELFRIGGIRSLKGFDEQAIFASTYIIGNIELRYLLQQNSNVLFFWNGAYYRNEVRVPLLTDKPYGVGAGFNFETGSGVFSIFYAVGKEFNNSIDFNKAKIHFGFVNYF
jgi:translocation and assembly module TamA